jgi:hypothetical protein
MSLADDYEHFELRDSIFKELHCSENLYKELVQQEKEKKSQDDGNPKIHLFFPQKEY